MLERAEAFVIRGPNIFTKGGFILWIAYPSKRVKA
jgi:hypothetical protein